MQRSDDFARRRRFLAGIVASGLNPLSSLAAMSSPSADVTALVNEAFVYAFPVHDLGRIRWRALSSSGPRRMAPNVFGHARVLLTHRDRAITRPNNDTLYSSAWLDLSAGPVRVSVPAMGERYWSLAFMDPFTDNVACVSRRTSGGAARSLWVVPPGWSGETPAGAQLLRMPANDLWLLGRLLVDGEADLPAVHALQDALTLTAPSGTRPILSAPSETDAGAFVTFVNEILGRNPVPERDRALLARVAAAGIVPGDMEAWQRMDAATRDAWSTMLPELRQRLARPGPNAFAPAGPGWASGLDHIGRFGSDYEYRARVALGGLGALEREEAIYANSGVDSAGERLDGSRRYRLRVPGDLPLNSFWSLSMYQTEPDGRAFFVDNPVARYTIGDRTPGLARAADGSITISLQHDAPAEAGERSNWLPAPAGRFSLTWRLYEPKEALLSRRYALPGIERLA